MSNKPEQLRVHVCDSLAAGVDELSRRTGVEHVPVIDQDWAYGPAGGVDLFAFFHQETGRSVGMHESILGTPAWPLAVYMLPKSIMGSFLSFLDTVAIVMPDGSVVIPVHAPAEKAVLNPDYGPLGGCHMIGPMVYPVGSPEAATAACRVGASAGRPIARHGPPGGRWRRRNG